MIISGQQVERILKVHQATYSKKRVEQVAASGVNTDKLQLSSQAQELQLVKDVALKSPDVRADKIDEIKKQINEGIYQKSGSEIAAKMIERSLVDEVAGR